MSHLLLSGVCTGPWKGGTADLDYHSEPCRRNELPNTILKSALGLNSLWIDHANIVSEILVNTDSSNGFLHDGTKPLSETMWAYHQIDQQGPVAVISEDYNDRSEDTSHENGIETYMLG